MLNRNGMLRHVARNHALTLAAAAVVIGGAAVQARADFNIVFSAKSGLDTTGPIGGVPVGSSGLFNPAAMKPAVAEPTAGGHTASSDVTTRTYSNTAATGLFSTPGNWTPVGPPTTGDTLVFNEKAVGPYTVTNDLTSTTFGDFIEQASTSTSATPALTLNGGFTGNRIQVGNGSAVINGGTSTFSSEQDPNSTTSLTFSVRVGAGDIPYTVGASTVPVNKPGSLTIQGGATVNYNDFLFASKGGTGNIIVTGSGTKVVPIPGVNENEFIAGGGGNSTLLIDQGASVTASDMHTGVTDHWVVSNGSSLTMSDTFTSDSSGTMFAGQIDFGGFNESNVATQVSTLDVLSNSTVTAPVIFLNADAFGSTVTMNVDASTVNLPDELDISDPSDPGDPTDPTTFVNTTLNIKNHSVVTTNLLLGAQADATTATINITGVGSALNVTGYTALGGGSAFAATGAGQCDINVKAGGSFSTPTLDFGDTTAIAADFTTYTGNTLTVDGNGSKALILGTPASGTDSAFRGDVFLAGGDYRIATLNVTNGGLIDVQHAGTPTTFNADGSLNVEGTNGGVFLSNANNATSTINVKGAGSTLNAGIVMDVMDPPTNSTYSNSTATINVTDGGTLTVFDDNVTPYAGQVFLGPVAGDGDKITVNIGGGTGASDGNSLFDVKGSMLVGGTGDFATATDPVVAGVATTININNGALRGLGVLVYPGSVINLNKGRLIGNSALIAEGGLIKLSATAAAGTGVLISDNYIAGDGGKFDLGKSGGISYMTDANGAPSTTDSDIADIRNIIVTNGFTSSAIAADTTGRLAIGYYFRAAGDTSKTSFFGVPLASTDIAVLFRVTLKGDANLDGKVNFNDLVILAQNYSNTATGKQWYQGDFNYSGKTDFNDLVVLAQNYNGSVDPSILASIGGSGFASDWALAQALTAPEPASFSLMVAAGALVSRRRRR